MKISSSTIATLAIAATAIGGASFGISAAITPSSATTPQVVNAPAVNNKIANPDTSAGQIASISTDPTANPTATPLPTPSVTPTFGAGGDDTDPTNSNPINPNAPSFGGNGDDNGSDENSNYGDDNGSDD